VRAELYIFMAWVSLGMERDGEGGEEGERRVMPLYVIGK